jgi:hypothetical protein
VVDVPGLVVPVVPATVVGVTAGTTGTVVEAGVVVVVVVGATPVSGEVQPDGGSLGPC